MGLPEHDLARYLDEMDEIERLMEGCPKLIPDMSADEIVELYCQEASKKDVMALCDKVIAALDSDADVREELLEALHEEFGNVGFFTQDEWIDHRLSAEEYADCD